MTPLDPARLDRAAGAAFTRNVADQVFRGRMLPALKFDAADDATKAAWRSVAAAAIEEWEQPT